MIDREFVEELVAQIEFGIGDKKNNIKKLYDISEQFTELEILGLKKSFSDILKVFSEMNKVSDFNSTRYSQRNDFYTLFGFIHKNLSIEASAFVNFYKLLLKIQDDISPSNEKCEPLQFYAYRCVSQSNSKSAREDRLEFLNLLLLNQKNKPNKLQKQLMKYYSLPVPDLVLVDKFFTLNPKNIRTQYFGD